VKIFDSKIDLATGVMLGAGLFFEFKIEAEKSNSFLEFWKLEVK